MSGAREPLAPGATEAAERRAERRASVRSRVIHGVLARTVRPVANVLPVGGAGLQFARLITRGGSRLLPPRRGSRVEAIAEAPVAGEWVWAPEARRLGQRGPQEQPNGRREGDRLPATDSTRRVDVDGVVLYLHGGGYVFGSNRTHRMITTRVSAACMLPVCAVDYRLAPEHPFPAALDDALSAYRWLLGQGVPPARIVVAGDSAGGHLGAVLMSALAMSGEPAPAGLALLSPWLDLSCAATVERDGRRRDPYLAPTYVRRCGVAVCGGIELVAEPLLRPLEADLDGFPPVLIQVGSTEALRGDAERLHRRLTDAQVPCELEVWPGQVHVFQVMAGFVPEAGAALARLGRFVQEIIGGCHRAAADSPGSDQAEAAA